MSRASGGEATPEEAEPTEKSEEESQSREAAGAEKATREAAAAAQKADEDKQAPEVAEADKDNDGEGQAPELEVSKPDVLQGKSSVQIADWFLKQVRELSTAGTDVDSLEFATVLKGLSPDDKQTLAKNVIHGLEDLPTESRAEVLRLVADMADGEKRSRLQKNTSTLFAEHPDLAEAFSKGAVSLLERSPQFALEAVEAVSELSEEDRRRLTAITEGLEVVPEEQRRLFKEAVTPGGLADKISGALRLALLVYSCRWVSFVLTVVELILTLIWQYGTCSAGQHWLFWDSIISILGSLNVLYAYYTLLPCYAKFRADYKRTLSGAQEIFRTGFSEESGDKTGLDRRSVQTAAVAASCALIFTLLSVIWAIIGIVKLLFFEPCSRIAYFVWVFFVAVKSAVFVWAANAVRYLWNLWKESRKLTSSADGRSYGSMETP